jgi:hypothetical protein
MKIPFPLSGFCKNCSKAIVVPPFSQNPHSTQPVHWETGCLYCEDKQTVAEFAVNYWVRAKKPRKKGDVVEFYNLVDRTEIAHHRPCPGCGTYVPYPTEPGIWEFCDSFNFLNRTEGEDVYWVRVRVEADGDEGELCLIPVKASYWKDLPKDERPRSRNDKRIWWPSSALWRKIK